MTGMKNVTYILLWQIGVKDQEVLVGRNNSDERDGHDRLTQMGGFMIG